MGNFWYGSTVPIDVDGHRYTVAFEDHENFQTGGVRRAFKGFFTGKGPRHGMKVVVKAFINQERYAPDTTVRLMNQDHQAYAKAREIVDNFSKALKDIGITNIRFDFAEAWITVVSATSLVYDFQFWTTPVFRPLQPVFVEPYLEGDFAKFTSNNGTFDPKRMTPVALSHFSWVFTAGECLLCDLQGIRDENGYRFSDPAIHSKSREYGVTDFGVIGMASFFRRHVCNEYCEKLGINNKRPNVTNQVLTSVCDEFMPDTMNTTFWKKNSFPDDKYKELVAVYEQMRVVIFS